MGISVLLRCPTPTQPYSEDLAKGRERCRKPEKLSLFAKPLSDPPLLPGLAFFPRTKFTHFFSFRFETFIQKLWMMKYN